MPLPIQAKIWMVVDSIFCANNHHVISVSIWLKMLLDHFYGFYTWFKIRRKKNHAFPYFLSGYWFLSQQIIQLVKIAILFVEWLNDLYLIFHVAFVEFLLSLNLV